MTEYPDKLARVIEDFSFITDRNERAEYLIEIADRFADVKVPPEIAEQPYPEDHRVQACESDAFVWSEEQADGTLRFYFDVLNPQGLSAMAVAVILGETLSGQPLEHVAHIPTDMVFKIFGRDVSMGKGAGLMGIVSMVQNVARQHLNDG